MLVMADIRTTSTLYDDLMRLMPPGWTENKWTVEAGINRVFFQDLRKGAEPKTSTLEKLLSAVDLSLTEFYALQSAGKLETRAAKASRLEAKSEPYRPAPIDLISSMRAGPGIPLDLPVFGTAEGAAEPVGDNGETILAQSMECTFDGAVEHRSRPPGLMGRRDVYGLYIVGDSMEPRTWSGELEIFDPVRPPSIGDFVAVYLRTARCEEGIDHDGEATVRVLYKRLLRRGMNFIELEQYNPPLIFRIPTTHVAKMHRAMRKDELT